MADLITKNMIAWKEERPWHGKGFQVEAGATGEQMLVVAGMNWEVERRKLAMELGAKKKGWSPVPMANYRSIVRSDNDFVFQIATDSYHPLQNREIVEFFREYCEAGHATMDVVGALKGGRIVWALAKLNGGTNVIIGDKKQKDEVFGYVLLATSHDGSIKTIGMPTQIRAVCWNTLSASIAQYFHGADKKNGAIRANVRAKSIKPEGVFMMKHTRKWTPEIAAEAKETMGMSIEHIQATNELAAQLATVYIDERGRLELVARIMAGSSLPEDVMANATPLGEKSILEVLMKANDTTEPEDVIGRIGKGMLEAMTTSPGSDLKSAKDTFWGAVNGVTYFYDHVRSKDQDQRLYTSWFGAERRNKQNAFAYAVQMAGIKKP